MSDLRTEPALEVGVPFDRESQARQDEIGVPFPSMGKGQRWGAAPLSEAGPRETANGGSASSSAGSPMLVETPHPQPFPIEGKGDLRASRVRLGERHQPHEAPIIPRGRGDFEHERSAPKVYRRAKRLRSNMTFAERKLWERLRKLEAPFRRQAPIRPYVVDFACHSANLVIEVDGPIHENLPEVAGADFTREGWLNSQGYRVLRLTNRDVLNNLDAVVERIGAQIRRA